MNNRTPQPLDCAVIGAGIAGLLAARQLVNHDLAVAVVDKARGVGGRMATRRLQPGRADHGAQAFTAKSAEFHRLVDDWHDRGWLRRWYANTVIGSDGMTTLPKKLAEHFDLRLQHRVNRFTPEDHLWKIECDNGAIIQASSVVVTCPTPQTIELLTVSGIESGSLDGISYEPCFALVGYADNDVQVPNDGAWLVDNYSIRWIADNGAKGISPERRTVTVHSTAQFAQDHLEDEPADVIELLQKATARLLGCPIAEPYLHRWRYSDVVEFIDKPFEVTQQDPLLVCARDGFGGSGVEAAALSGMGAADAVISALSRRSP